MRKIKMPGDFDTLSPQDSSDFEKLGPGTKSKVQVQRRSLGPKHFTKLGLHTHHHHHTPTHKILEHFRGT